MENFEAAASRLEGLKKSEAILGIPSKEIGLVTLTFTPKKGDKGLTYLVKRYYKEVAGYSDRKALDASLALSAKFIRKSGESDPKLQEGDELSISENKATLTRTNMVGGQPNVKMIGVELEQLSAPPRVEESTQVKRQVLMKEVLGLEHEKPATTPAEALAQRPLKKSLEAALNKGRIKSYITVDKSLPHFGLEAYEISLLNGPKYYLAAQLTKRSPDGQSVVSSSPKYRLVSGGMMGNTVVNWTSDFEDITSHLA